MSLTHPLLPGRTGQRAPAPTVVLPSQKVWCWLDNLLESQPWGAVLSGWPSLGGGWWIGHGKTVTLWVDRHHHLWHNGQDQGALSAQQPFTTQLNGWMNRLGCQWQPSASAEAMPSLPNGGWVIYLGYEAAHLFDAAMPVGHSDPDEWPLLMAVAFQRYDWLNPTTGQHHQWHWPGTIPDSSLPVQHLDDPPIAWPALMVPAQEEALASCQASWSPETFQQAVTQTVSAIEAGEFYQANLSLRLERAVTLSPLALLAHLLTRNPSVYSGALKTPWGWLISNSPEQLVHLDSNRQVTTRPIAGTRGLGPNAEQELLACPKERAEHQMLVDLERNDLGRVCQPGSVRVTELMTLEAYSHVTHLVSEVVGQCQSAASAWDVLAALFPGGTITGCPKIRCMSHLAALEPTARTFYTGSLGWLDGQTQTLETNILIRSVRLMPMSKADHYRAQFHAGAGIVADSHPAHEYRESLRKASAMAQALATLDAHPPLW